MPPVVAAVAAGAVAAFLPAGITILGTTFTGLSAGLVVGAANLVLGFVSNDLPAKPTDVRL